MSDDTEINFLPDGWESYLAEQERVRAVVRLVNFGAPEINVYSDQHGTITWIMFEAPTWRVGTFYAYLESMTAEELAAKIQGIIDSHSDGTKTLGEDEYHVRHTPD